MTDSNSQFAMLACDIFNIREKLTNQEYIDISNKMKTIKDIYDAERAKTLKLFKANYKLQKEYIKTSKAFTTIYNEYYNVNNDDDDDCIEFT